MFDQVKSESWAKHDAWFITPTEGSVHCMKETRFGVTKNKAALNMHVCKRAVSKQPTVCPRPTGISNTFSRLHQHTERNAQRHFR